MTEHCRTCAMLAARNEEMEAEMWRLRSLLRGDEWDVPQDLGLTPAQRNILKMLVAREGTVRRIALFEGTRDYSRASSRDVHPDVVDVVVCKLRQKLRPWGLKIECVWGEGYRLPPETRQKLLSWNTPTNAAEAA